jgi:hypothetical protein
MQPATIRRLLVFGVCIAGVGGLYLMPTTVGSPTADPSSARWDLPTARPSIASVVAVTSPELVRTPGSVVASPTARSTPTTVLQAGADRPAYHPMATADRPGRDKNPPDAVGRLSITGVDAERLTVTWPEATDDVGVVAYQVWLNGFLVVSTQQPRASLPWFNDSTTHVVQVRALDAVGNEGPSSPTLLVARPSPTPAATTSSPSTATTDGSSSSPAPRTTAAGGNEAPDTTNTPAPTSGPHRSSDAEKEESS